MIRATVNFIDLKFAEGFQNSDPEALIKKVREKERKLKAEGSDSHAFLYDSRNGIYCLNPKIDSQIDRLRNYLNYLEYLNANYDSWNMGSPAIAYLDCGLVPISYGPSFYSDQLNDEVVSSLVKTGKIDPIYLRASSVLTQGYVGATKDVWIKRSQLAQILNVTEEQATCSNMIRALIQLHERLGQK